MVKYQDTIAYDLVDTSDDVIVYAERPRLRHILGILLGTFAPKVVVYTRPSKRKERILDACLFDPWGGHNSGFPYVDVAKLRGRSVPLGVREESTTSNGVTVTQWVHDPSSMGALVKPTATDARSVASLTKKDKDD